MEIVGRGGIEKYRPTWIGQGAIMELDQASESVSFRASTCSWLKMREVELPEVMVYTCC